jgi:hypothetical protein
MLEIAARTLSLLYRGKSAPPFVEVQGTILLFSIAEPAMHAAH